MLLQTNSYIVPKDKRAEHTRQIRRFRQTLLRLGCDHFEVYEQVGPNWSNTESTGRYVQIMRFIDRKHQLAVQNAERSDPTAQAVIAEFCELINFPYQQQQGLFAIGFYTSVLPILPPRTDSAELEQTVEHEAVEEPQPTASEGPADTNGEHLEAEQTEEPITAETASEPVSGNGEAEVAEPEIPETEEPNLRISGSNDEDLSDMVNDFLDTAEDNRPIEASEPAENADPLVPPFEHADHKKAGE